ncbi:enoyl-CoA hydratase-related protein [Corynebacterium mayonis]|uniref:enoyl-CoA hydratase-related protein n=1 Tax=Corynebacterium mayonis TaxID=3062461 RepID=UPI0031402963
MLVISELRGDVALVTINRHNKRNAISVEVARALVDALEALPSQVRAVVLTGAGSSFSAGADLGEDKIAGNFFAEFFKLTDALRRYPAPVIAHINGPAIGAGMMLSMACDLRTIAPAALFRIPLVDMAIGVDEWTVSTLSDLVGGSRARQLLYTGAASEAETMIEAGYGLSAAHLDEALSLASSLAAKAPLTMRSMKTQFERELFDAPARRNAMMAAFESQDVSEAARARAEKRPPTFRGL